MRLPLAASGVALAVGANAATVTVGIQINSASVETPGPSAALFAAPPYTCVRNFYVATNGSDANAGTLAAPWLTIQKADTAARVGGDCVNVQPGTYAAGASLKNGGNQSSPTGYVVYRCMTQDGCKITESDHGFAILSTAGLGYIMIDGFELAATTRAAYGVGILIYSGSNAWPASGSATTHHIWVLNSVIHGYGQSGIQTGQSDWNVFAHNQAYGNAGITCDAQGSGISLAEPLALAGYTPTAFDLNNPVTGTAGASFHQFVTWNHVYNNALTSCGTPSNAYDTDGNGIIADTWNWNFAAGTTPYVGGGLIAFNVSYNNGGGSIILTQSQAITVANNSVYNSYLDPANSGSGRGTIFGNNSYGNTFINNVSVSIPAAHTKCAYNTVPYAMWNNALIGSPPSTAYTADSFSNNITNTIGTSCQGSDVSVYNGDAYSATANKKMTNPLWVSVGDTMAGSQTTPPVGANFALQPASPVIGYGQTKTWLSPQSVDAGACPHQATTCP